MGQITHTQKVGHSPSAAFLTHARLMYENAGFIPMPQPTGFPEEWRDKVYFMERSLT